MDNWADPATRQAEQSAAVDSEPDDLSGGPVPASAAGSWAPPQVNGSPANFSSRLGLPSPVLSNEMRARITAPFAAVTKRRLKSGTTGREGRPIDDGDAMTGTQIGSDAVYRSPAPQPAPKKDKKAGGRGAQLVVAKIEPWSVMKFSFLAALVAWVVLFVAVAALYYMLSSLGVFSQIEQTIGLVTSTQNSLGSNAASWFAASTVLGYTMLVGAIDVVLITVIATIGAVIYNAITRLTGGIEVTLKDAD